MMLRTLTTIALAVALVSAGSASAETIIDE